MRVIQEQTSRLGSHSQKGWAWVPERGQKWCRRPCADGETSNTRGSWGKAWTRACSQKAKPSDQVEPISVPFCSAAADVLSNPAAPLRQRPDSHPEQECKVWQFLATEMPSNNSHQGLSLLSTGLRYFLPTGLFVLLPICQSWLLVLLSCCP